MKLVYYELKKLASSRLLWMLLVICLLVNGVLCYTFTEKNEAYPYLKKVEADYVRDPDALYDYYERLIEQSDRHRRLMEAYYRGELTEAPVFDPPCTYSGDEALDDRTLIGLFLRQMNSKEHFERDLEQVIRRAKAQQAETLFSYSLFGEDGFAYQQQGLIVETYTDIYLNAELHPEIAYGWDQFFAFDTVNLFLLLLIIAGVLTALLPEAGSTAPLVRSTKRGRGRTGLFKLIVLLLFSLGSTLLLLLSTYLGVLLKCGELSSLSNSIAVFAGYDMVPLCVSVGEYLCLLVLSKLLLGCGVAMLCTFLCLLLRNILLGCISTLGVTALSALLYGLLPLDAGRFLNLYGVSRFVRLTEAFRCVDLFGYAVLLIPMALALVALLGLFCGLGSLLLYRRAGSVFSLKLGLPARLRRLLGNLRTQRRPLVKKRRTYGLSPLGYEFRKTFLTRSGLFLLVTVMLFKIGLAANTYTEQSSRQTALYGAYMDTLTGPMTPEKRQFIEAEYERIQTALNDFDRMRYAFLRGELDGKNYDEFLKEYSYAADRADSIERIRAHADYLDTLPEKGVEGGFFLYDLDWERLLSAGADLLLIFYTVLAFTGVFAEEYGKSGMVLLLRSTKNGRERLFWHKLLFTLTASGVITLLFTGVDTLLIATCFELPAASAPLLSLELFGNASTDLSIGQFLSLGAVVRLLSLSLIAVLSAMLGALIKSRLYALLAALAIVFLPRLAAALGLAPLRYIDVAGATFLPDLLLSANWGYVWGFWATLTLTVCVLIQSAKKEYCK